MKEDLEDYINRIINKSEIPIYGITICERGKEVDTFSISNGKEKIIRNFKIYDTDYGTVMEKVVDGKLGNGLVLPTMPHGYVIYKRARKSHIGGGRVIRVNKAFIRLFFSSDICFLSGGRRYQIEEADLRFKEKVKMAKKVKDIKKVMKEHENATLPLKVRTLLELIEEQFTVERAEVFNKLNIKIQDAIFNISSIKSARKLLEEAYTIKRRNLWFETIDFAIKALEKKRDNIFDNIMNGFDSPKYPKKLTQINERLSLVKELMEKVKEDNQNNLNSY
ncbi:g173 [Yersinia phage phiR1-37]|uniref:hypothetical protein n=1 Tax=Yersinia phage phiR1-37 TaxID=331278 RepID=UPI00022DBD59|nr:hypothetical protein phiR1-37_gp173 [Yersinia phage phiR1-37]CCE26197.1 g173 [Yersinia phage phiR1-37]